MFDKYKSLLELKQERQKATQGLGNKHNIEVEIYQVKYKALLEELEKARIAEPKPKKNVEVAEE